MTEYMVKVKGKIIDYTTIPKRARDRAKLIAKWRKLGYKLIEAPNSLKAMETATRQRLKRKKVENNG